MTFKIISNINGGLGNQMFQYAAGFAVAQRLDYEHRLDVESFQHCNTHHGFELHKVFYCSSPLANAYAKDRLTGGTYKYIRNSRLEKWFDWMTPTNSFIREPYFHYWQGVNALKSEHYLIGYWQSEKYFGKIKHLIEREFTFRHKLANKNRDTQELILSCNAVSVHIRHGDYIHNPKANRFHGICPPAYYQKAFEYLMTRFKNLVFFVFSDDISWVKENIIFPSDAVYIDHNHGADSHYDMQLISQCQHHIIANSSFSWWGAWLSKNREKVIIAPQNWFADARINTTDITPNTWIRL